MAGYIPFLNTYMYINGYNGVDQVKCHHGSIVILSLVTDFDSCSE